MFLYIHDGGGGRRTTSGYTEVARCVYADAEGELYAMAGGANTQFPRDAYPVSNCEYPSLLLYPTQSSIRRPSQPSHF